MRRNLAIFLACLLTFLSACESQPVSQVETEETLFFDDFEEETYPEDELYVPDPYYFDESGVMYIYEGGRYWLYEDYEEIVQTPESTAFLEISYIPFRKELHVQFRNSGDFYIYYDVSYDTWVEFKSSDSKGGFFNEYIKGYYEYDRA